MKFPIKVGDENEVANYSKTLLNDEEQLLITRNGKQFLTDGKGGYIQCSGGGGGNTNIDDTTKSATTTYSSEKIETITGDINDATLDASLKGKSLQEQIKQVFTCANSNKKGKDLVGNAIGRNYTNLSYENISNDILLQKKNIARALKNKGVSASDYEELDLYAEKINLITQNVKIKNIKLDVIAPFTKQIVLDNPTMIENVCTSVLEYQAGDKDIVQYKCRFNNSDSNNFKSASHIIHNNGIMKQEDYTKKINFTKIQENSVGEEQEVNVDLTGFYKTNQFEVIENADATNSLNILGTYNPTLVITKDDINLLNVERLSKINWIATSENNSKLLLLISTDSGTTWKGYNRITKSVKVIDTNNLKDIRSKGISIEDVNKLNIEDLALLREDSPKIKFAYYFEKDNTNDLLFNDEIILTGDMKGINIPSKNVDYKLESDGKTITYNFIKDGTYTITYCNN